jgi:hypothetical protein
LNEVITSSFVHFNHDSYTCNEEATLIFPVPSGIRLFLFFIPNQSNGVESIGGAIVQELSTMPAWFLLWGQVAASDGGESKSITNGLSSQYMDRPASRMIR